MEPLDPAAPIAVTLQAQQWNAVLATLAEAPYRIAAPLIKAISEQAMAAANLAPGNGQGGAAGPPHAAEESARVSN